MILQLFISLLIIHPFLNRLNSLPSLLQPFSDLRHGGLQLLPQAHSILKLVLLLLGGVQDLGMQGIHGFQLLLEFLRDGFLYLGVLGIGIDDQRLGFLQFVADCWLEKLSVVE